ncbi:MAG TPA: DoxX family protein [Edaphobacter sp.]|jgi:uncharacterized membrane protein YphA (DoxX/SURF4 family)
MSTREKGYWTVTSLVVFALLAGGMADVMHLQPAVEGMTRLGYPRYVLTIVGTWKILGGIAILWPGMPRLKEWAYAGVFFVMTGAAISHAVCGETGYVIAPTFLAILGMSSWALQQDARRPRPATSNMQRLGVRGLEWTVVCDAEVERTGERPGS